MSIFVPQVNISMGGVDNLTPVPPEYLKEFRYTSTYNQYYEIEAVFFEPWSKYSRHGRGYGWDYESLEDKLMGDKLGDTGTTRTTYDIQFTFGVRLANGEEYMSLPLAAHLNKYSPQLTDAGMEITIQCLPSLISALAKAGSRKTYEGKRSDVVRQLCDDFDFTPAIEETDDMPADLVRGKSLVKTHNTGIFLVDALTSSTTFDELKTWNVKPKLWTTGSLGIMQFIRKKLLPGARSLQTGRTDYKCQLSPDNILRFAPPFSKGWYAEGETQTILKFPYLAGTQSVVKSFSPDFLSDMLGSYGVNGAIKRHYNPHTHKYSTFRITPAQANLILKGENKKSLSLGDSTHVTPLSEENSVVTESSLALDDKEALAIGLQNWEKLASCVQEATMTAMGTEKTIYIQGGDVIYVEVLLPDGSMHWSSGYWIVQEAKHVISGDYTIDFSLIRDNSRFGSYEIEGADASIKKVKEQEPQNIWTDALEAASDYLSGLWSAEKQD